MSREADLIYIPKVKDLKDAMYVSDDKDLMIRIMDNRIENQEENS